MSNQASLAAPDVSAEVQQIAIEIVNELLQASKLNLAVAGTKFGPDGIASD
jgi:hypothetical protein